MADVESVDQVVELLPGIPEPVVADWYKNEKQPTLRFSHMWPCMGASEKKLWALRYRGEVLGISAQLRRKIAVKIAIAVGNGCEFTSAQAEDYGKALARFALAAADKILE